MRLKASDLVGRTAERQIYTWTDREYLLYALALGFGADAAQSAELPFVYERELKIVPIFPTVLAWVVQPTFQSLGAAPRFALHVGQSIDIHGALRPSETIAVSGRVIGVLDKGAERGAIIDVRQEITGADDSRPIATLVTTCFARDLGGCGSAGEMAGNALSMPQRPADHEVRYAVRPEAALIYRLTGDRNPLHADPAAAAAAGFPRPILHGLCTFGMMCRAVLARVVSFRPESILHQSARFTGIVFPGDRLDMSLWVEEENREVFVEASVAGREVVAMGRVTLKNSATS